MKPLGSAHPVPGEDSVEEFTNAGASSFIPCALAAIGMRLATAAGAGVAGIVLSGKAMSGLVYLLLIVLACYALRRSRWRWVTALVALIPLSVFQAAVLSADTFCNAVAILFVALVLSLQEARVRSLWRLIGLAVAAFLLIAAKPTYLLLVPLLLLVPNRAIGLRSLHRNFAKIGLLGLLGVWLLFSMSRVGSIADAIRFQVPNADRIDRARQLEFLLANPAEMFAVVVRTFVRFGDSWLPGSLAMFGTNIVTLPQPLLLMIAIAIALAAFYGARRNPGSGTVYVACAIVTVCAVIGTLYLTFTPVGAPVAHGVQGRYWIPLLLPAAAGAAMLIFARLVMKPALAWGMVGGSALVALIASFATWCWVLF
ncbi:putative membrane protein DUF2142 [Microbacterium telephonicum]|uniref:Putative membrane protein DUF2142 n=1 Tax=Microbacterium telephonicum TaxID=1714841 RepID=A0A498BZR7_9MICO|nr:putative membrane protein DUF2142 [Microbacterium telephonicum]